MPTNLMMPRLLVIDPLTLIGRELLLLMERDGVRATDISYLHTDSDPEHQIAELAGEAKLVPPLDSPDELAGWDAILVASESDGPRVGHVARFMDSNPATAVVIAGRPGQLRALAEPAAGPTGGWTTRHLRVAHPSLVALVVVASALQDLEPLGGTMAALDPVSPLGREALQSLARQARQRLSGAPVEEMIEGHILAFNLVATDDSDLDEDASLLLPDLDLAVTHSVSGCFHGHVAHIGLTFSEPLEEAVVRDAILADARLIHADPPLRLDGTPDTDEVVVLPPRLSRTRRHLAVTAMVDGLRVGGARTALDVIESLVGS